MSVSDQIRQFIIEGIGWKGAPERLLDESPLMDAGVIDSMGVFHLISFLEEEFGIEVLDEDLVPNNFATIANIEALVSRRGGVPQQPGTS